MPLISIIIPYYAGEKYISDAVQSISTQSVEDLEIIIVNDELTESAATVLEMVVSRFPDLTIRIIENESNQGQAFSRNVGLKQSEAKYVSFLDADDMLCGRYSLESRINLLEKDTTLSGVAGYPNLVDADNTVLVVPQVISNDFRSAVSNPDKLLYHYCQHVLVSNKPTISTLFFCTAGVYRRDHIKSFPFNSKLRWEEDVDWLLTLLTQKSIKIHLQMLPVYYWRQHNNQNHLNIPYELVAEIKQRCKNILMKI